MISEINKEIAIGALQSAVWLRDPLAESRGYPTPNFDLRTKEQGYEDFKNEMLPATEGKPHETRWDRFMRLVSNRPNDHVFDTYEGEAEYRCGEDFDLTHYAGDRTTRWVDEWYGTEMNPRPAFVVKYRHNRVFGGPEEGGWYRSVVSMVKWTVFPSKALAEIVLAFLKEEQEKQNKTEIFRPHYESLGGDDTVSSTYTEGYIPTGWVADSKATYYLEPRPGMNEYSDNSGYE